MAIDFTLEPELEAIRLQVREFVNDVVKPGEVKLADREQLERREYLGILGDLRRQAREAGLWLPHMPKEWAAWGSATCSSPWCRPRRRSRTGGRSSSTARRPTRATCTR